MRPNHTFRVLSALTALGFFLSCGGDTKDGSGSNNSSKLVTPDPCKEELSGKCGGECDSDSDCDDGLFCRSDDTCGAECTPEGEQCMGTCQPNGECDGTLVQRAVLPASGSSQDLIPAEDDPNAAANGDQCIEVVSGFEGVTPTVLIVVDRSGSMDASFDMGNDRWDTVRNTLTDPDNGLIHRLEGSVRFGLMLYTSVNPPGEDSTVFEECPMLVETPLGLNNFNAINSTYGSTELIPNDGGGRGYQGHTPTGESLQAATATLAAYTEPGPKAIVLATDGEPDNCSDGDAHTRASQVLSLNAVTEAFNLGIKTFVISVGDETGEDHLKELAVAGQDDPAAEAYPALSTAQLESAFAEIVGGVRSCTFALQGEVPDFHAENGSVTLGGEALTFNDPDGWELVGGNTVEIKGAACQTLLAGDAVVNITFPCVPEFKLAK